MANQKENNIDDQIAGLRCSLRSDDDLQVISSGNYENIRMRLDHDIQLSFLFDFLTTSTETLNLGNIHDLRLTKISSKCPLNNEQWQKVQKRFNELRGQEDPSKYPVRNFVQDIQDYLLEISVRVSNSKVKSKKNSTTSNNDDTTTSNKFRGADLIFNRILFDPHVDRSKVLIGYEDRFTGVHEIPFNEFKKVHDHEYGVPMHRIRHYKVDGKLVWDRTKKYDILTGGDMLPTMTTDSNNHIQSMIEGVYQFDSLSSQWILCTQVMQLSMDDPKIPSTNDVCLPTRCHFLTWNILFDYHHSSRIHTDRRYTSILETLKSLLPDVICLQEVTVKFLTLLLNQSWLGEHNYYITIMGTILRTDDEQPYGQLILTKNVRPRSFEVIPIDLSEQSSEKQTNKRLLITRFGLSPKVTIDLVNVHLHSNRSKHAEDKRCQTLENLFRKFQTKNYMFIGDFNFGDYDEKETNLLKNNQTQIHDLWKETYNLENEPGFTFDPSINSCAAITSSSLIKRRFDRYLIHHLNNFSYSVEYLTMIAKETIPIDPLITDADKRIHQSDHFALQLILNFRTRSISHRSAFALIPSVDQWPLIEPLRQQYDPSYERWPPHINILWPFFDLTDSEDDQETILLPLRLALMEQTSFQMTIESIETFSENHVTYMKPDNQSNRILEQLFECLKRLFPQCCVNHRNNYTPHMTIGQGSAEKPIHLKLEKVFSFPVNYLYILQRPHDNDTTPFRIAYQLPLGSVLQRLSPTLIPNVDPKIREFFESNQLYYSEESYLKKKDKFDRLEQCFQTMFNNETLHCFKHQFLSYGSFRFGIDGEDLDTVFVLREQKSVDGRTDFDETLEQLKNEPTKLNDRIVSILEGLIKTNFSQEIEYYRNVKALFPIISIVFKDKTRVEIFVEIQTNNDENSSTSIHGVFDNERLLNYVRSPTLFQHVLSFVRRWSKNLGIYGQVYGYLGGFAWAILCATTCHSFFSSIENLSSIEEFRFEQFFELIRNLFLKFSRFNWTLDSISFDSTIRQRKQSTKSRSVKERGAMKIFCPASDQNSARTTIRSTKIFIEKMFEKTWHFIENVNTTTIEEKYSALEEICRMKSSFPSEQVRSLLELKMTSENQFDLIEWSSWIKSRLIHFFDECDNECHLIVEPSNKFEQRTNSNEIFYFVGFQFEQENLFTMKNFSHFLKKFIDQCFSFENRNDSMILTHRIISIDDWKLEKMEPKPQRIRK